jgi:tetratricopeptide (TPR) repeat protein
MEQVPRKFYPFLICVVLVLATTAVYWQAREFEFVHLDDTDYVTNNPHVRNGLTRDGLVWAFTTTHSFNWHPLTWLSLMLDCHLSEEKADACHTTNLLLHIANTLLLFLVLRQMTGVLWQSAFVAAAFALHPLHTESVAWVSERKDVLSTFFWMLTMWAYVRYTQRPRLVRYVPIVVFLTFGLMAKPMLVTLPFVLLLLDYWPLERFQIERTVKNENKHKRKSVYTRLQWQRIYHLIREKVPLFALSAASSVVTFIVQQRTGAVSSLDALPLNVRTANALISYAKYIAKILWPTRLAVFYPHPISKLPPSQTLAAALLLLAISIAVIRLARRYKYLPVGWLWYLGTLLPVIGLVQIGRQAIADRYTYIPLTGLFIMIAWGLPDLLSKWKYRKATLATATIIVLLTSMICTRLQVAHWRNSTTLFEHALKVTDGNYLAHCSLADAFHQQGNTDKAIAHNYQALQIWPDCLTAHVNLAAVLLETGKLDEAIKHSTQALRIKPELPAAHQNLGNALLQKGLLNEAIKQYHQVLQLRPDDPDACNQIGIALTQQEKLDQAATYFTKALKVKPNFPNARRNLGHVQAMQGNLDQAITNLKIAVQLDPNSATTHSILALTLIDANRTGEAVTHLRESLRIKPDWDITLNNLAWLLATNDNTSFYNPKEAVQLAEHACKLTNYQNPSFLDTLAVAYAAAGKFAEAIDTAQKALLLAQSDEQKLLSEKIQNHLRLFKEHQPYIETSTNVPPNN